MRGGRIKTESLVGRLLESSGRGVEAGKGQGRLEPEQALGVKKMPAERMGLAERGGWKACLWSKVPGRRNPTGQFQESSPGQTRGAGIGKGSPRQRKGVGGSEGPRGPGVLGGHKVSGWAGLRGSRCALTCGARLGRLAPAWVLGAAQGGSRRRETSLGLQGAISRPCP